MNQEDGAHPARVLVIDDNQAIHDDFRKILAGSGIDTELEKLEAELFGFAEEVPEPEEPEQVFEISCALQGKDGLEILEKDLAQEKRFDMAFVDMRMPPGWDGVETIERLWQADPDLQIVICTAYSDHSFKEIASRLSNSNQFLILKKPFDTVEISQAAAALSSRRRKLDELTVRMDQLEQTVASQSRELEAAEADAEQLLQSISSLLVSLDTKGRVRRWNPVAEQVFDLPKNEVVGEHFDQLDIRWQKKAYLRQIMRAMVKKRAAKFEVSVLDSQGESRRLGVTVYPTDQTSRSSECLILGSDITEQTFLEEQLQRALRLEAVGQLAAGVAHEINTPIQYIGDNVRYLEKCFNRIRPLLENLPVLPEKLRLADETRQFAETFSKQVEEAKLTSINHQIPDAIQETCEGIESIASIVAAMKEFSHPGSAEKTSVDLNHVVSSAITVAKNEWKLIANVLTSLDLKLPEIQGLPMELNQAFLNIIVNACHAIASKAKNQGDRGKGSISISSRNLEHFVEVRITDTGGGIPEDIRDRIFEPFFTTKEVGRGTGQGLAIAHAVFVQKHNGRLWCEVQPNEGTTFVVQLPKHNHSAKPDQLELSQGGLCP